MRFSSRFLFALAGAGLLSAGAHADPLVYNDVDTRTNGHSQAVASPSEDADGSLRLTTSTSDSTGKVDVLFSKSDFSPLGTLGNLNQLALDYFKSSAGTVAPDAQLAFRLNLGLANGVPLALVWENQYNGSSTVPTDAWTTANILGGNFWQRGNNANFNGGPQAVPISSWLAGHAETQDGNGTPANSVPLNANTPVYGLEASYGSGAPGLIDENVDHVTLGFGGGSPASFTGNVVAPEPASMGLIGIAASLLGRRRTIA